MSVTREQVLHVAALARLHLAESEVEQLTSDLNRILAHVSALETADLTGSAGVSSAVEWPAPLRADNAGTDALAFPPSGLSRHWQAGFFTVPTLPAHDSNPT